jgi:hypothetical protein
MDARDWLDSYGAAIGVPAPTDEEIDALLGLASAAAHASHRTAAPVACWMAARAGLTPAEARARAEEVG